MQAFLTIGAGLARILGWLALAALVLAAVVAGGLWLLFRPGAPHMDLSGPPVVPGGTAEAAITLDRPVGNAAVGPGGRVFFTLHPAAAPDAPRLMEWRDGRAVPFPDAGARAMLQTPLGLQVDGQGRLWVIDHGRHGLGQPALVAFDLATGGVAHRHEFAGSVAPMGSYLQDLAIGPAGRFVYIADAGVLARRPALIVHDTQTGRTRRLLSRNDTVMPQDFVIRAPGRWMTFLGGLLSLKVGLDGLALSPDGATLYFAPMNGGLLYRVPTALLHDAGVPALRLSSAVEVVARKPLSDGIATGAAGQIYVTDIEHGAIHEVMPWGARRTIVKDARIRWADSIAVGPEGALWIADSALQEVLLTGPDRIATAAPYTVWRVQPPAPPPPPGNEEP